MMVESHLAETASGRDARGGSVCGPNRDLFWMAPTYLHSRRSRCRCRCRSRSRSSTRIRIIDHELMIISRSSIRIRIIDHELMIIWICTCRCDPRMQCRDFTFRDFVSIDFAQMRTSTGEMLKCVFDSNGYIEIPWACCPGNCRWFYVFYRS